MEKNTKQKTDYYELKSPIQGKVYTKSCIHRYSSNGVRFTKLKHFLSKLRKFPLETYINVNGKDIN